MTETQALAACRKKFGPDVVVSCRRWVMPSSNTYADLFYCWDGGVIRAVGGSWEDLAT